MRSMLQLQKILLSFGFIFNLTQHFFFLYFINLNWMNDINWMKIHLPVAYERHMYKTFKTLCKQLNDTQ